MYSHYLFIALDIAGQRAAEASQHRLAETAHHDAARVNPIRRLVARTAVAVARVADETAIHHSPTAA